jgi:hypothetical protein
VLSYVAELLLSRARAPQLGFPFVLVTTDVRNYMCKGVIESHVGRFHERPGQSLQDRVFIPGPLLDSLVRLLNFSSSSPAHTRKFEVVHGSPDTVAGRFDQRQRF